MIFSREPAVLVHTNYLGGVISYMEIPTLRFFHFNMRLMEVWIDDHIMGCILIFIFDRMIWDPGGGMIGILLHWSVDEHIRVAHWKYHILHHTLRGTCLYLSGGGTLGALEVMTLVVESMFLGGCNH